MDTIAASDYVPHIFNGLFKVRRGWTPLPRVRFINIDRAPDLLLGSICSSVIPRARSDASGTAARQCGGDQSIISSFDLPRRNGNKFMTKILEPLTRLGRLGGRYHRHRHQRQFL